MNEKDHKDKIIEVLARWLFQSRQEANPVPHCYRTKPSELIAEAEKEVLNGQRRRKG